MKNSRFLTEQRDYFTGKFREHGATPQGLDYNSPQAQELRFAQFERLLPREAEFSLLDYGCGYGALRGYLRSRGYTFRYTGFDISQEMIAHAAQDAETTAQGDVFESDVEKLQQHDFVIACGVFNLKFAASVVDWTQYVTGELDRLRALAAKGMGFNMLTSYSDADRMRDDLYYGDPCFFFDHCKRSYARNVALLHDYELYDFTMIIRFDS